MWGDTRAAPVGGRRDVGTSASTAGETDIESNNGMLDAGSASATASAHASDDEEEQRSFSRRASRFDEAEQSFTALMRSMDEHKEALARVAESGCAVAEKLHEFFTPKDAACGLASSFLASQRQAKGEWVAYERRYEREVVKPMRKFVEEIPGVRARIKQRAAALQEMKRLQRKTASDGKPDGRWGKLKQRRLKELKDVSAMYAMHHSDVMRKFSNIERNKGNFVSPSLKSLVGVLADASSSSVAALEDTEKLVAAAAGTPMTRELSPPPMGPQPSAPVGEKWDDSFVDEEPVVGRLSATSSPPPPPLPAGGHARTNSVGGHARSTPHEIDLNNLALTEPTGATPDRRAIVSTDTASLPDINASPRAVQFVPVLSGNGSYSGAPPPAASVSSSSGEAAPVDFGDGADRGSSIIGTAPHSSNGRRRTGADKGSSDTVPSDGAPGTRPGPEVLARVMAVFDFSPREVNEIELRKGDVVEVSEKIDSGWWYGRCKRSTGFFPQNYTRELTETEEVDFVAERQRRRRERRQGHRRQDSRDSRRSGRAASLNNSNAPTQP